MSKWDKEYLKLCKEILTHGELVKNRTGIDTIKIPSYHMNFDLNEETPVLTTKQFFWKNALTEILWIYQIQSNDVRDLQERNNNIWNEWAIEEDGYWRATQNVVNAEGTIEKKDIEKHYGKEWAHTIGTAYGWIVKHYDLMNKRVLNPLKNNQTDRRMVMSLWQDEHIDTAVLPSCVWSSEWDVTDKKLNTWVHQRSCDVPLGLPFNVFQYAMLQRMVAQVSNLTPGTMDWSIKDAHIYVNQIDAIKEQLQRYEILGDFEAPEIWLNPEIDNFYHFDNSKELKDVKVLKYNHHGKLNIPIAK